MRDLPPALRWYLWTVYVACLALVVGQTIPLIAGPPPGYGLLREAAFFLLLTYIGERTYLQVGASLSQSLSTTVHLTVVLLLPPPYPVVITFLAVLLTHAGNKRKPLYKRAFNVCHATLTVGLSSALAMLIATPRSLLQSNNFLQALPIVVAYYVLDAGLLVAVFALLERRSPWLVWRQAYRPLVLPEMAACTTGVLAAVVWLYHPVLLALFVMPVAALRAAFRAIAQAEAQAAALRRRSEQLEAVLAAGQRLRLQQDVAALLRSAAAAAQTIVGAAAVAGYVPAEEEPHALRRVALVPEVSRIAVPLTLPGRAVGDAEGGPKAEQTLLLPLEREGMGIVGMLRLMGVPTALSQGDRDALAILATETSIALENAHLFRQAQEARHAAEEAVRVRDDFLTAASHDLRTPLTVISGLVQVMLARLASGRALDAAQLTRQIATVNEATTRMRTTVEEITDAAQLQMGQPLAMHVSELELGDLVRAVVDRAHVSDEQSAAVPLSVQVSGSVAVQGDRARLERVVENIVANAIKYSPQGTPVRVEVRTQSGWGVLVVRDSGVGIPSDELPHIFTHFYRASTSIGIPGTGIGLAGSKTIVEQHGGRITIESAVGHGTTVTVSLPLLKEDLSIRTEPGAVGHATV